MSEIGKYDVPELHEEDVPGGSCCIAESTFATLFPAYLEKYISAVWDSIEAILKQHQLVGKLDVVQGAINVSTTRKTWDPYAILCARDFTRLLARNVPLAQAQKIFQPGMFCDIVKIGEKARNTRRFIKRRDRLIGPEGQTLKALEILTNCYVLVQGKTVAVMGTARDCREVRKIVGDCMRNIHPIYGLKRLLVKRELMKREDLKNENWDRFIPQYKKSVTSSEKQKEAIRKKKATKSKKMKALKENTKKSIFPPQPPKRKEDIAMETGEVMAASTYQRRKRSREDFELRRDSAQENQE